MAGRNPLFDKAMTELREAFVRNRFAQEDVFDTAGIEQWLAQERVAVQPDWSEDSYSHWNGALCSDHMMFRAVGRELALLAECASPDPEFSALINAGEQDRFVKLLSPLRHAAEIYCGHSGALLLVRAPECAPGLYVAHCEDAGDQQRERLVLEPAQNNALRTSQRVMDVLFLEWLKGRPKWQAARQFLCDSLAELIAKERASAEWDFDAAVAVSADGKRIIHADWVVVRCCGWLGVYPAGVFQERKALRSEQMVRLPSERAHSLASAEEMERRPQRAVGIAMCSALQQFDDRGGEKLPRAAFLEFSCAGTSTRVYLADAADCSQDLPRAAASVELSS
ncbi:hypothetical protein HYV74_05130 [Candidatus Uhrbacteria bacterium]|nr:hypothetical protein [Candidatus Uhrbacteria bacterium]